MAASTPPVKPDPKQTRTVATNLLTAFANTGIFGTKDMPEDLLPAGITTGSEDHLRFITLTVAIDYMRDADQLWEAARLTHTDPATTYLFDPTTVANTGPLAVVMAMQAHKLSKKAMQDARTWQTICVTLAQHFGGSVGQLLATAHHDALKLLALIRGKRAGGFPFLKGPKIGPLWVRMLHDNCGVNLANLASIPLPIDIHTAQAAIQTGCVTLTQDHGTVADLRTAVQEAFRDALANDPAGNYSLRLDKPLWLLSRNGCRRTPTWPCAFRPQCPVAAQCQSDHLFLQMTGNPDAAGSEWQIRRN